MTGRRSLRWAVGLTVGILGLLAAACWWVSILPYDAVKPIIDRAAVDGDAAPFEPGALLRLRFALRLLAAAAIAAAAALIAFRRPAAEAFARTAGDAASLAAEVRTSLARWLRREEPHHLWALAAVIATALAARWLLLFQPMRYDEAFSFLSFSSKPWYVVLGRYDPNNHVLHNLAVHVLTGIAGIDPWAIRLAAFIPGVLVVPATYAVMRFYYDKHAALLTAAWVAGSATYIEYATNARGHSLLWLIVLLLLGCARYLKARDNSAAWALFAGLGMAGFATLPTMAYAFGMVVIWLAWSALAADAGPRPRAILGWLAAVSVCVAAGAAVWYAPAFAARGLRESVAFGEPLPWDAMGGELAEALRGLWGQWRLGFPGWWNALVWPGAVIGLIAHRRVSADRVPLAAAALASVAAHLAIQRIIPLPRHWAVFAIPCIAAAAAGLLYLFRLTRLPDVMRSVAVSVFAAGFAAGVGSHVVRSGLTRDVTPQERAPAAEGVALELKRRLGPHDAVAAGVPSDAPLEYYFLLHGVPRTRLGGAVGPGGRLFVVTQPPWTDLEELLRRTGALPSAFGPAVLVGRYPGMMLYEVERHG